MHPAPVFSGFLRSVIPISVLQMWVLIEGSTAVFNLARCDRLRLTNVVAWAACDWLKQTGIDKKSRDRVLT